MKKKILNISKTSALLLFAMVFARNAFAQFVYDYKKSADLYYSKGDFYTASVYYEKYLDTKVGTANTIANDPYVINNKPSGKLKNNSSTATNKTDVMLKLAESYRMIHDFGNAEKWYHTALTNSNDNTEARYWYAVCLRANAKYDEAKTQLQQYLNSKGAKNHQAMAQKDLENLNFAISQINQKNSDAYTIDKPSSLNTTGATYASTWTKNGLSFTSTRSNAGSETHKNAIYITNSDTQTPENIEKLDIPSIKNLEQGVASFSPDAQRVYFTAWSKNGEKKQANIYTSEIKDGKWLNPVKMGQNINLEGYSSQQPFVTADGSYLIFSSDRAGGEGKFDLWYAPINADGSAGEAINLGKQINTAEDEQAPYYQQSSKTLVFSSTGKIGLGGFDFFKSQGSFADGWSASENMGYPVNSNKDDLYFCNREDTELLSNAFISSDRSSACCLELLSLSKKPVQIIVEKQPEPVVQEKPKTEQKAYFDFDKYNLNPQTLAVLDRLFQLLQNQKDLNLEIIGYTDSKGSDAYNQKLSEARANACKDYLVNKGLNTMRITAIGKGKAKPSGDDAKDRRAEFRMVLMD